MDDFLDMVNVSGGEVHYIFGLKSKSIKGKISGTQVCHWSFFGISGSLLLN
jgi:hypothetical protein